MATAEDPEVEILEMGFDDSPSRAVSGDSRVGYRALTTEKRNNRGGCGMSVNIRKRDGYAASMPAEILAADDDEDIREMIDVSLEHDIETPQKPLKQHSNNYGRAAHMSTDNIAQEQHLKLSSAASTRRFLRSILTGSSLTSIGRRPRR